MRETQLGFLEFVRLGSEHHVVTKNRLKALYIRLAGYPGILPKISQGHAINAALAVPLQAGAKVLDAGCGMGFLSLCLARRLPQIHVLGIDASEEKTSNCNTIARALGMSNVQFRAGQLEDILDQARFDLICCVDVLEHIEEDEKVLSNFRRVLKDDGRLIVVVPRPARDQLQFLRIYKQFPLHVTEDATRHVRDEYSFEEISAKLTAAGFSICSHRYAFGRAGRLAFELSILGWNRAKFWSKAGLLTYPVAVVLAYLDLVLRKTRGNSMILIAVPAESHA